MLDDDTTTPSDPPTDGSQSTGTGEEAPTKPARKTAAKKTTTTRRTTKKAAAAPAQEPTGQEPAAEGGEEPAADAAPAAKTSTARKTAAKSAASKTATAKKSTAKKTTTTRKSAAAKSAEAGQGDPDPASEPGTAERATAPDADDSAATGDTAGSATAVPLFKAPEVTTTTRRTRKATTPAAKADQPEEPAKKQGDQLATDDGATKADEPATTGESGESGESGADGSGDSGGEGGGGGNRRRRRRGGRRRRKPGEGNGEGNGEGSDDQGGDDSADAGDTDDSQGASGDGSEGEGGSSGSRRRRRRRRAGDDGGDGGDDPENTVTRVRKARNPEDEITAISGSTRLEAKKQRRRDGREAGRRRAPIVSEAEFLARRESVDRTMVIRQREDLTQIAVLEDKVLVEHYVARESQTSLIGNVYLGRVQNVLPSMEAAFIDIGKGRNAVLYAGEVNWSALGHKDGQPRKIESVLSSGQSVLVQVTKDPVGHKGARLTSQVSLAGRFLVYVPDGTTSGISRKLPDTERSRLKTLLKEIVPDSAGVIVRTAAEGAAEDELTRDVERLKARWEDIEKKAKSGNGPKLLYGEPDLTLKVVRDLFTEDFGTLVIQGDEAWETVQEYVAQVAPDLQERLEKYSPEESGRNADVFAEHRIDEQIAKGLDRKVWLPSGGSLIIDRTEAMTVVDVNTGKFTGSGGNLEETVTKNNLEAAEEIVRQLRLRDIGGIIVVDFIDMVLESNRDLVLRRLVECLGRDRTRHQVAEVTSLGLVQMTRKRIGTGLLEAFSENCEHCGGRGLTLHDMPVEPRKVDDDRRGGGRRARGKGGKGDNGDGGGQGRGQRNGNQQGSAPKPPSPKDVAAVARPENADRPPLDAEDEPVVETETAASSDTPSAESEGTSGSSKPASDKPASTKPAPDKPDEAEPAAADSGPGDPAPSEPVVPAAPKVVTRTRRRAASRPAGPPPGAVADESASEEPGSGESVPTLDQVPPAAGVGAPPSDGATEPGVAEVEPGPGDASAPAAADVHVPVKKKGSRKR